MTTEEKELQRLAEDVVAALADGRRTCCVCNRMSFNVVEAFGYGEDPEETKWICWSCMIARI